MRRAEAAGTRLGTPALRRYVLGAFGATAGGFWTTHCIGLDDYLAAFTSFHVIERTLNLLTRAIDTGYGHIPRKPGAEIRALALRVDAGGYAEVALARCYVCAACTVFIGPACTEARLIFALVMACVALIHVFES